MSNAIVVPDTFKGPVAAVFQGQQSTDDLSGGITGGYGLLKYRGKVWSIQHNGNTQNLMREDGDGPRGSVDIIVVKANPQLSKTWYENGWDENSNNPPDCASANGVVPDQGVPKKQADVCAMCPRNAWGSAPGGGKGKACGDHRRMAIVPLPDPRNEFFGGPLLLRCPAASLQDMAAFEARYRAMGYPYFTMGIKISFDPMESFPKFVFQAIRPLTEDEGRIVLELRDSPLTARVINEMAATPVTAIGQGAAAQQTGFLEPPPVNAVPPQQVVVQPGPVTQPTPAAAPVQQPSPQPAVAGHGTANTGFGPVVSQPASSPGVTSQPAVQRPAQQTAPAQAGGFGAVAQPAPQPAAPAAAGPAAAPQAAPAPTAQPVARPVAPPAATQMTGFGAVTPEVTQQAAPQNPAPNPTPAPAATQATAPGVVSAFEGSIDERLNALLSN